MMGGLYRSGRSNRILRDIGLLIFNDGFHS